MKLRKFGLLLLLASVLLDVGARAHAQAWTVTDEGVTYRLFENQTADGARMPLYPLILGTTRYAEPVDAFLHSVDVQAWKGKVIDNPIVSAPIRGDWTFSKSTSRSGVSSGCGSSIFGVSCAEASTDRVLSVDSGRSVHSQQVTGASSQSFSSTLIGARADARIADGNHGGAGSGATSVTLIAEPKLYAMMLAGLGLMGFVAQRRQQGATA